MSFHNPTVTASLKQNLHNPDKVIIATNNQLGRDETESKAKAKAETALEQVQKYMTWRKNICAIM